MTEDQMCSGCVTRFGAWAVGYLATTVAPEDAALHYAALQSEVRACEARCAASCARERKMGA